MKRQQNENRADPWDADVASRRPARPTGSVHPSGKATPAFGEATMSGRGFISAHPRAVVSGAVVIVALVVFAIAWFEPHKLFIDDAVDEAIPTAEAQPANGSGEEARPPKELAVGDFQSLEH